MKKEIKLQAVLETMAVRRTGKLIQGQSVNHINKVISNLNNLLNKGV